jgi:3'(2'), 5'-bisphosphate nucleotidase
MRLVVSHNWPGIELPGLAKILKKSSVGLKAAMIVDGDADAYVSIGRRIKVWDTCAPAALVMAAGGVFMAISGEPLCYTGSAKHGVGILAASSHAAPRIKNLWNSLKRTKKS